MEENGKKTPFYLRWAAWAIIAAVVVAAVLIGRFLASGWSYSALKEVDSRAMD